MLEGREGGRVRKGTWQSGRTAATTRPRCPEPAQKSTQVAPGASRQSIHERIAPICMRLRAARFSGRLPFPAVEGFNSGWTPSSGFGVQGLGFKE